MNVFCSVVDSPGAFVPYISVLASLQDRGGRCLICVPEDVRWLAETASLPFVSDSTDLKKLNQASQVFEAGDNSLKLLLAARRAIENWVPNILRATWGAVESGRMDPSDTVVVSNSAGLFYLGSFWLELGFSRFVCLEPYLLFDWCARWRQERSQFLPAHLPRWIGSLVFRELFARHGRSMTRKFLGRPPAQGFAAVRRAVVAQWHMCSPQLIGKSASTIGYCYPSEPGSLPPELSAFLTQAEASRQRIVLFTIGSMELSEAGKAAMVHEFLTGLERVPDTVGVILGHGESHQGKHFFQEGFVPYQAIFPRVHLVVCHGGSGTTHLALQAGVPVLMVPFLKDQFDWAQRLDRLGMLVATLPRQQFRAHRLVEALTQPLTEKIDNARFLGEIERSRHGDGLDQATDELLQIFGSPTDTTF